MSGAPDTRQACDKVRRRHENYRRRQSADTVSMPAKVKEARLFVAAVRAADLLGDVIDLRSAGMHASLPSMFPSLDQYTAASRFLHDNRGRGRSDYTRLVSYPHVVAPRSVAATDLEPLAIDAAETYRALIKETRGAPRGVSDPKRNAGRLDLERVLYGLICLSLSVHGPVVAREHNRVWAAVALNITR